MRPKWKRGSSIRACSTNDFFLTLSLNSIYINYHGIIIRRTVFPGIIPLPILARLVRPRHSRGLPDVTAQRSTTARIQRRPLLGIKAMTKCGDVNWPFVRNGMCCHIDTEPLILAGNTTVLCCPMGFPCKYIKPTICGREYYRPQPAYSDPPAVSTIWDQDLPKCGTNCCPWGYSCDGVDGDGEKVCTMLENQCLKPDGKGAVVLGNIKTVSGTGYMLGPTITLTIAASPSASATGDSPPTTYTVVSVPSLDASLTSMQGLAVAGVTIGLIALVILISGAFLYFCRGRLRNEGTGHSKMNDKAWRLSSVDGTPLSSANRSTSTTAVAIADAAPIWARVYELP